MLKRSTQKSSKKLIFLLSICMGMAHIVNSQVIVQGVNYSSGTRNYCSNDYIISPSVSTSPASFSGTSNTFYTAINYVSLLPGFTVSGLTATGSFTATLGHCPAVVYHMQGAGSCDYKVTAYIKQNNGTALTPQIFPIGPGIAHAYYFTPQSGYTLDLTTLQFSATAGTSNYNINGGAKFDKNSPSVLNGNCYGTISTDVTHWDYYSTDNYYRLIPDIIVGGLTVEQRNALRNSSETDQADKIENNGMVLSTSMEKNSKSITANTFKISPNPSAGLFVFNARNENPKDVFVYDITGRIVFEKINTTLQIFNIDIAHCPQGIYILKVVDDNQIWTEKIIKAPSL